LEEWVNVYCSSFNICFEKKIYIFRVLKQQFNFFKFILYKIFTYDKPFGDYAGCCLLFSHRDCLALYCLGTLQKYRNKKIATEIIDFAINFAQRNGYRIFGLQTLQSDDLIHFYKKKGFDIIYRNTIYQRSSS
jgi:GNAT superfamily N-acetyltransferase